MKKIRSRGINEIKVKLLPEKAKRDFLLRLISSIIIMIFLIINFFLIFLPRRNLINDMNVINSRVYALKAVYNEALEKLNMIDKSIFNMKRNNDVEILDNNALDITKIIKKFDEVKPTHSFIENVNYNEEKKELIISVQFDTLHDLTTYQDELLKINYVNEVKTGNLVIVTVQDGSNRYKTNYLIVLDIENTPKVGDTDE